VRYTVGAMRTLVLTMVIATAVTVTAQSPNPAARSKAPAYAPSKTAWGDPDLQGTFTDKDENGIPIEKPAQFQGKSL